MAEPLAVPKEPDKQHSLDLTSPPLPDRTADSDSYEEWDEDEYVTEEEEEEEEEEDEKEEDDEEDEKKEDEEGKPEEVEKKDEKEERLEKMEVDIKEEGEDEKEAEKDDMSNTNLEISVHVDTSNVHGAEEKGNLEHDVEKKYGNLNIERVEVRKLKKKSEKGFKNFKHELNQLEYSNTRYKKLFESLDQSHRQKERYIQYDKTGEYTPRKRENNLKTKEKFKRHSRYDIAESSDKFQEFHLKPLTPLRNTVEEVQIATMPQEKTRKKFQPKEKPILDEDELFEPSNEVDLQSVGSVWPEELTPVPEIGSDRWVALMEQIRYKNPYEGYVPEETKEPMEAIWDRFNRLDYQEGRYVDEDMFMNEDGTLDMDNMTVEDMEDLTKKFHSESNNKEFKFDYSESVDSMGSRL